MQSVQVHDETEVRGGQKTQEMRQWKSWSFDRWAGCKGGQGHEGSYTMLLCNLQ